MTYIEPVKYSDSVLVVDDEPFTLRITAEVLERIGFKQVLTADNVTDTMNLVTTNTPAVGLVLVDLNMPGSDGLELLRHFEETDFRGDILLISGEDERTLKMAESLACARGLSVLGTIAKPLRTESLLAVLSNRSCSAKARCKPSVESETITPQMLESAIDSGELKPWFQPKIHVASRAPVGVEVLARWPNCVNGPIFPNAFIPLAEECGLIDKLTFLLVEQAANMDAIWRQHGIHLEMAFNVSMHSLHDTKFPDSLEKRITSANSSLSQIKLEVTESRLREDLVSPLEVLLRLRMKKVKLSIDDFGTGHSNLHQLRDLPFDELKLDRSYVQSGGIGERTGLILESTVEMAKKLGMSIVAEGVETLQEWQRVEQLGCDQVQGYFTAKPMPGEEISDWLASWPSIREELIEG
jgi:EAL domain-containing protein (putative c-di-GMP-specific phosphodiesterase class I)/CheY-like chemotaxis protein